MSVIVPLIAETIREPFPTSLGWKLYRLIEFHLFQLSLKNFILNLRSRGNFYVEILLLLDIFFCKRFFDTFSHLKIIVE